MDLGGCAITVAAGVSEAGVSSEAFDQVLHLGYLEELADHEGFEVPLGLVLYGSSGAFFVEVFPEGGMDGS